MQVVFSRKSLFALLSFATGSLLFRGSSEVSLLRAAKSRDREAFDRLRESHTPALRKFATRRLPVADVDDVLQDTWISVWEGLPNFEGEGKFKTWVYSICFHKVQDHWRREHYRPHTADLLDVEGRAAYLPKEFANIELRQALEGFWQGCSPEQRELLKMYYSDGLTLKEIGQILGRNLNTVKYQFYRVHELASQQLPKGTELIAEGGASK
jgi:RNA polymerase sigma-70 factor (ECF subfamily)